MIDKVRNIINSKNIYKKYFQRNKKDWNILCASMDIIDDTDFSIKYFQNLDLNGENDPWNSYLSIYGVLQCIYAQQDAIQNLYKVITKNIISKYKLSYKKPIFQTNTYPTFIKLRKIRNILVGHASECSSYIKKRTYHGVIIRNTIEGKKFNYYVYGRNKDKYNTINLSQEINKYLKEIEYIINKLKEYLENKK